MDKSKLVKTIHEKPAVFRRWSRMTQDNIDLTEANLREANLSWANLRGANLSWASLTEANLTEANLSWANLTCASLSWANLREANLRGANLTDATLSWAKLTEANLREANLREANLRGANLTDATLSWANLTEANLTCANLRGANLTDATLSWANLTEANLTCANLTGANLTEANLSEANLTGANLSEANLSGCSGLLSAKEWVRSHFEYDDNGNLIVYRAQNGYNKNPDGWVFEPGAILTEVVNPDRCTDCGCGVAFATLEWVKHNHWEDTIWQCHIEPQDFFGVIVPFGTDGKARCERLVLDKIVEKE
jgi:uncharacterized protein YjbI with pentapeptide repeats